MLTLTRSLPCTAQIWIFGSSMLTDKIYIDIILKTKTVLRIYLYLQVIKLSHCTLYCEEYSIPLPNCVIFKWHHAQS